MRMVRRHVFARNLIVLQVPLKDLPDRIIVFAVRLVIGSSAEQPD